MSALEMTANGEVITAGAAQKIDEAIGLLHAAQGLIAGMQEQCNLHQPADLIWSSSQVWFRLESIDDRIHEALSKLGD